ncbi:MAG: S-methyl-5-thioribose-1-phosphate isomerase [Candidatus Nanoarchaeia archaeon]|nr:S-methyl-5-thioribose-1-phosphate isomerase [Candidatus Nanoarchaeia archaeon]
MDLLKKTAKDIKSIKIQGATNLAEAAIKALEYTAKISKAKTKNNFISELEKAKSLLYATRPTEPLMRNSLRFIVANAKESKFEDIDDLRKLVSVAGKDVLNKIEDAKKKVSEFAGNKIENGMTVFTHCHSSTVMGAFRHAKLHGKKFSVICTESRPLFQGRKTGTELVNMGVPVTMIIDSNVSAHIKKADMVMVGADLITSDMNFVNKVGTQNVAYGAKRVGIPLYVCTDLAKFDPETMFGKTEEIEQRSPDEVWKGAPKQLKILNPAFDLMARELVTAYITQEGVIAPESVLDIINEKYSWITYGASPKSI